MHKFPELSSLASAAVIYSTSSVTALSQLVQAIVHAWYTTVTARAARHGQLWSCLSDMQRLVNIVNPCWRTGRGTAASAGQFPGVPGTRNDVYGHNHDEIIGRKEEYWR